MKKKLLLAFIGTILSFISFSQTRTECVECNYSTANGSNASVIGTNNSADGSGSVAMGTDTHTTTYGVNT